MFRNKFIILAAMFILFAGVVSAYSDLGGGWCGCGSAGGPGTGCIDCTNALNNNTHCTNGTIADGTILDGGLICIDDPANFSNKVFDLNGSSLDATVAGGLIGIKLVNKTNVTIANGTVGSPFGFDNFGIYLENVTYADIHNVTVNGTSAAVGPLWSAPGIFLGALAVMDAYTSNSIIYNCTVVNNHAASPGIYLSYCHGNEIWDTTTSSNGHGIWVRNSWNNQIHDCIADNNVDVAMGGIGFACWGSDGYSGNNTFVRVNASSNVYGGMLFWGCSNSTVDYGRFISNAEGIVLSLGAALRNHNVTVSNNMVSGSTSMGIHVADGAATHLSASLFLNNRILSTTGVATNFTNTDNNTLINNRAYLTSGPIGHAYYFSAGADNNTLIENTAYNNTGTGFYLDSNEDNTLINSTSYDNYGYGVSMIHADDTFLNYTVLYNNTASDLYVRAGAAAFDYIGKQFFFLNPSGAYVNFTNLSMEDSPSGGQIYTVNWTANSTALPAGMMSFENKFVDISIVAAAPTIDRVIWYWLDSELPGYFESNFELWKFSDATNTWSDEGATLNIADNSLTITNLDPASDYGILQNLSVCPVITSAGAYQLQADLVGAPNAVSGITGITQACVIIASDDVVLLANGHTITNNGTSDAIGIVVNGSLSAYTNVTIRDFPSVSQYEEGIGMYNASFGTITNNTAYNNSQFGIVLSSSSNNNLTSNDAYNNTASGIRLQSSSNNTLHNNTAYINERGIVLTTSSDYNNLTSNNAYNNTKSGIYLGSSSNYNNLTNNNAYNNTLHGIILTTTSDYNTLISNNAYNNTQHGISLVLGSNNNLTSNDAYYNTQHGISLSTSSNNILTGNDAYYNTQHGISLSTSSNNNLTSNNAYNNTQHGISLFLISNNNNLTGNNAYNNTDSGVHLRRTGNIILNHTVLYNNGHDFYAEGSALGGITYTAEDMLFLNPAGTMVNYTNLSITDVITTEEYTINWTTNSSGMFDEVISFENKWVNISTVAGAVSIDELTWHWTAAEAALPQYTPAFFKLMEYKGTTWSIMNDTPDTGARTLSLYALNPASDYGILQFNENLTIVKTLLSPEPVVPGDMVEFQLVVNNTGNTSFFNVEVFDELPVGLTFNATNTTQDPTVTGQIINWTFATLAPNTDLIILLNATVDTGATPGEHWNDANVTAMSRFGINYTNSSNASVQIEAPAIYVQKTVFPQGCYVGADVTYTLNITNTGSMNLTIVVNDTLGAGLLFLESDPINTSSSGQTIYWSGGALNNLTPNSSALIVYNVTATSSGNLPNDVQVRGEYATGNVTASNSTLLGVKSHSTGGGDLKPLDIEIPDPRIVNQEVTLIVTTGVNTVSNAEVLISYYMGTYWEYFYPDNTDSSGETSFIPPWEGEYKATASKSGYYDGQEYFDVGGPLVCMEDSDCTEVYGECYACEVHRDPADNQCVLKQGADCGVDEDCPAGYTCEGCECVSSSEPECETDEDCPPGWECIDEECVEIQECTTDEDCPDDQYCADGTCEDVPCFCGEVINHECNFFECCNNETCWRLYNDNYFCNLDIHECVEIPPEEGDRPMDVDVPDEGSSGDEVEVIVTSNGDSVGDAEVSIYLDGQQYAEGVTDGNGQMAFTAGEAGEYTVVVTKPGFASAEDQFVATSEGDSLWETIITGVWLLLFILIVVAIFYVLWTKKRKKRRPKA